MYIETSLVTVIGAANMDINGFSASPLNWADSNPGRIEYCAGGVGRNIAENLLRLGVRVKLIGALGDDPGGAMIAAHSREIGLDIEDSLFLSGAVSPVYLALLDSGGELAVALSDMGILEQITPDFIESRAGVIEKSGIVVVDANLSGETIGFISERFRGKRMFLDPVSARKAEKVKPFDGRFHALKLGRMEAECLSGVAIPRGGGEAARDALARAGAYFMERGTGMVCITLGGEGVYFQNGDEQFFAGVHQVRPVNTSGGGDAFMAGMVYAALHGFDSKKTVAFASAAAAITVQSKTTVAGNMSADLVEQTMELSGSRAGF
ncbi:MAG: PfkB family carbohydrate kinase [Spirochaetaceae bacterium]|jgi:pseudouridine kinase|nr:PfkB family carbohydrate kinase [Spirochaetaceae bacterium]